MRPALSTELPNKPLRADAARNRAQVLAAARELFATHGVTVPLDKIARRAAVGPGTVHRHFPSKNSLLAAIVVEDLERRAAEGFELAATQPADGLFQLLDRLLDDGLSNLAVKDALATEAFDLRASAPATSQRFNKALRGVLSAAQRAGTARGDLGVDDVKAALAGALAAQQQAGESRRGIARAREIVLAGLHETGPAS